MTSNINKFILASGLVHGIFLLTVFPATNHVYPGSESVSLEIALVKKPDRQIDPRTISRTDQPQEIIDKPKTATLSTNTKSQTAIDTKKKVKDTTPKPDQILSERTTILANDKKDTRHEIKLYLLETFSDHFYYPALARRKGLEGKVKLDIHITAQGNISTINIIQSSGHRILDNAAISSLSKIKSIPKTAGWQLSVGTHFVIPVEYRLYDI